MQWGYADAAEVASVVANYSAASIPLETQWVDIDYMDRYLDFTLDPVLFPQQEMAALVDKLHGDDQYFVPIVDPGIYVSDPTYPAFVKGVQQDVFVKDLHGQDPYLGQSSCLSFSHLLSPSLISSHLLCWQVKCGRGPLTFPIGLAPTRLPGGLKRCTPSAPSWRTTESGSIW